MNQLLEKILKCAVAAGAFDVHIKTAFSPVVRVANEIKKLDLPAVSPAEMDEIVRSMLDKTQKAHFQAKGQVDSSCSLPEVGRVRANIFLQRNSLAISMRLVPPLPPEIHNLGFSEETINAVAKIKRGMILVTGATNSGKSTTAASIIDLFARRNSCHIITIEDPIEYVFSKYPSSIVSQRQVGNDAPDFAYSLNSALRQDPDIILIGELRDQETVETCLKASETGHLVIGTLHTSNAVQSVLRMINIFPSFQRDNIRFMLSSSLKMVISQVLLPSADHKSRILAYEVLPVLPSVANLIRQKKIHEISSILRLGRKVGCIPMNTVVKDLLQKKLVRLEDVPQELCEER